ncbi:hypothetical protein H2204_002337 [Knufia peltigerae]|uniref:Mannan endo-1,6-alpha-mannosidase n=1 Tax=Knufia peltigerae TaxID=1002370 RepID=A0AA38YBB1_9EURO|nr:hypothetical protein H2204_002337 [Knufia peltigerae]
MVITTTDPGTSSSNVAAAAAATQQQQQRDGGIPLNVSDDASIRHAASVAAYSLQSFYNGNRTGGTLGKFPYPPYYWWLSGAAWDGMLHYWLFTGDESYNNITWMALVSQISPTNNYLPVAEMFDEGNDDIAFWAFAAMFAAEHSFPDPPSPRYPSWLRICENVFDDFVTRWEKSSDTCGGGLRWQVFSSSAGWDYKNSISNGGFFQLAARLARYTGNGTYLTWAEKVWDWSERIGLVEATDLNVYDGAGIDSGLNCTKLDHTQWSYNIAVYLYGAAVMHNITVPAGTGVRQRRGVWTNRTEGLLGVAERVFFGADDGGSDGLKNASGVMVEQACELDWSCDVDQFSFKAYLARWMADTTVLVPHLKGRVGGLLKSSAKVAVKACTNVDAGDARFKCGAHWYMGKWDGSIGVGQSLSVLEVVQSLLVNDTKAPEYGWISLGGG